MEIWVIDRLLDLWQEHVGLSYQDRKAILSANARRQEFAHGGHFAGTRGEVEQYARFVQSFMGTVSTGRKPLKQQPPKESQRGTTNEAGPEVNRPRKAGGVVVTFLVSLVAFLTFNIWITWYESLVITLFVFLAIRRRYWFRTGYAYIGGIVYGYFHATIGVAVLYAAVLALIWPASVPYHYISKRSENPPALNFIDEAVPAILGETEEGTPVVEDAEEPGTAQEAPVPAVSPVGGDTRAQIEVQVQGNSNVRAGPGETFEIIGYALDGEVYDVLETNPERTWYRIKLASGREGWIGSSRVVPATSGRP